MSTAVKINNPTALKFGTTTEEAEMMHHGILAK
jgi:hypothetical protein